MEQLILNIKDRSKLSFLKQLLKQFDFVEIEKIVKTNKSVDYDFFNSAGLWENREVNAAELRKQAWKK